MNIEAIRAARRAKGMTQKQAAEACGMSMVNYQRLERGRASTTVATLERVTKALGLRLEIVDEKRHD